MRVRGEARVRLRSEAVGQVTQIVPRGVVRRGPQVLPVHYVQPFANLRVTVGVFVQRMDVRPAVDLVDGVRLRERCPTVLEQSLDLDVSYDPLVIATNTVSDSDSRPVRGGRAVRAVASQVARWSA
jgi:hypothetical protein